MMVTVAPPARGMEIGETDVTAGGALYRKVPLVADVPPRSVCT